MDWTQCEWRVAIEFRSALHWLLPTSPSRWGPRDLAALADLPAVQGIMLPKASSVEDVRSFREAMTRAGAVDGLPMWCLIETPRGVLNASAIAEVGAESFGVTALGVGTNDLTKELGCAALQGRAPLLTALSTVVMAARAFGLSVVDGVYNDTSNAAGFAAEALQARQLGFDGKCLIHPGTVQACNAAFSPSDEEVAWAKAVVEAWQGQDHGGVVTVQGALVEALHVAQAEATLLRASAR